MKHNAVAAVQALIFLTCVEISSSANGYSAHGQIPSTINSFL